jgi:catechol 2,3-dioxygenase
MRTSPEFARCPMGTYVDPEKMIKARGAGMSPEELLKRGYAGEFPPEKEMDPTALM